ncbi:MAG: cytochrome C oxidase subunit IV family protein [Phycisphaerales bacterium]
MAHSPNNAPHAGGHGHANAGDHPLVGHLVPISTLLMTGGALLLLTVITVSAHYIDAGELNIVIALTIAAIKATLVGLYFMHLRWDRPFNQLVFVGSVLFVVLLMAFCTLDTRQYERTLNKGNPKLVQETLDKYAKDAPIASKTVQ